MFRTGRQRDDDRGRWILYDGGRRKQKMKKMKLGLCALLSLMMLGTLGGCSSAPKDTPKDDTTQEENKQDQTENKTDETETPEGDDASATESQNGSVPGGKKYTATIKVKDYGDIVFEMDEGIAPLSVENFVNLAKSGFYDGLTFHRIMDGFMIQGGDPNGNGTGHSSKSVKGEFASNGFNNTLKHVRGTVSMARAQDPNSGSCQFFIVDEDSSFLDGDYAAFGTVTEGMDVVDKITAAAKPTDDNGTIPAAEQPVIESITITEGE